MQATAFQATRRALTERRWLLMSGVVLLWSIAETVNLAMVHTTGAELYGVLTAVLSCGAAGANIALLRAPRIRILVTGAAVLLWAVIAVGGIAGTIAHIVGPVAGHGPMDLRPRPIAAPLVFTLLGMVGAASLVLGQRMRIRMSRTATKE